MNFRFSDEEEAFRMEVREFIEEEMTDTIRSKWLGGLLDTPERQEFVTKMSKRGWLSMGFPKEYGGSGESMPLAQYILNDELHTAQAPIVGKNLGVVVNTLLHHGREKLKQECIPRILKNEIQWALAYTEPDAGSDLAAIQTRAVRDGDDFVINGQKTWTTGAHRSNWGWLAARTDPDAPKHKGLSMFLVPMDAPGVTIQPLVNMAGNHGFNEVFFEDVRIPAKYLVGKENMGWYMLAVALDFERSSIAGSARVRRSLKELVEFSKEYPQFIENKPEIRNRLADIAIEVEIGAALSSRVAALQADGKAPNYEATIAKLYSTELIQRFASTGMELLGMYGPLHPKSPHAKLKGGMERGYQLAVSATIAGGTSEVMKTIGAIRGLGLPRP